MEYRKDVLLHLSKSLPPQVLFFWRAFDFQTIENSTMLGVFLPPTMDVANSKDLIITPYCGFKNLKTFLKMATNKIHDV
jgi:hypothetical protein